MRHQSKNIIIKSTIFEKSAYTSFIERVSVKFIGLQKVECTLAKFIDWSLFASIFGVFTAHGDKQTTPLFFECLEYGYLPKIHVVERSNKIKVCICIDERELNEKKRECRAISK